MFKTSFKAALLASAFAGLAATAALADEAVVTPAPAVAPAEEPASPFSFSGTVGFTTDYKFRGLSQTEGDPAIFGSFDVSHESGLYAGIWASSIDFTDGDAANGIQEDDANLEFDFYAGFANSINAFSYDIGGVYYMYPGANEENLGYGEYNYYEIYGKTGYDFGLFSINDGVYYSPEFFGEVGDTLYGFGGIDVPLPFLPFSTYLFGTVGYQAYLDIDGADYMDWSGGLGASALGFDLKFSYVGSDASAADLGLTEEAVDSKFVFTISRTL